MAGQRRWEEPLEELLREELPLLEELLREELPLLELRDAGAEELPLLRE